MGKDKKASRKVVVTYERIPKKMIKTERVRVDTSKVSTGMVVNAWWVHDNLEDKNLVAIDARSAAACAKGHIDGAIHIDRLTSDLRSGADVARLSEMRKTAVIDSRLIDRFFDMTKHEKAEQAGDIPGAINVPLVALYMDNGFLKQLLWMLHTYGITPDKAVITTCDTGIAAADAFFILRYLGFTDVRVHDEAWVNWSRTR